MLYNDIKLFLAGVEFPFNGQLQVTAASLQTIIKLSVPQDPVLKKSVIEAMPLSRLKYEGVVVQVATSLPNIPRPQFPKDYVYVFEGVARMVVNYDEDAQLVTINLQAVMLSVNALTKIMYSELSVGTAFNTAKSAVSATEEREVSAQDGTMETVATAPTPVTSLNSILFLQKLVTGDAVRGRISAPADVWDFTMNNLLLPVSRVAPGRITEHEAFYTGPGKGTVMWGRPWGEYREELEKAIRARAENRESIDFSGFHMKALNEELSEGLIPGMISAVNTAQMGKKISKFENVSSDDRAAFDRFIREGWSEYLEDQYVRLAESYQKSGIWSLGRYVVNTVIRTGSDTINRENLGKAMRSDKLPGTVRIVLNKYWEQLRAKMNSNNLIGNTFGDRFIEPLVRIGDPDRNLRAVVSDEDRESTAFRGTEDDEFTAAFEATSVQEYLKRKDEERQQYLYPALPHIPEVQNSAGRLFFKILASYTLTNTERESADNFLEFLGNLIESDRELTSIYGGPGETPAGEATTSTQIIDLLIQTLDSIDRMTDVAVDRFLIRRISIYPLRVPAHRPFGWYPLMGQFRTQVPGMDILKKHRETGTIDFNTLRSGNSLADNESGRNWQQFISYVLEQASQRTVDFVNKVNILVREYQGRVELTAPVYVPYTQDTPELMGIANYVQGVINYLREYTELGTDDSLREYSLFDVVSALRIYNDGIPNRLVSFNVFRNPQETPFPTFPVQDFTAFQQIISGVASGVNSSTIHVMEVLNRIYAPLEFTLLPMLNKFVAFQSRKTANITPGGIPHAEAGAVSGDTGDGFISNNSVSELFLAPTNSKWVIPKCNVFYLDTYSQKQEVLDDARNQSKIILKYHNELEALAGLQDIPAQTFVYDMLKPANGLRILKASLNFANTAYDEDGQRQYLYKYLYQLESHRTVDIDSRVGALYKLMSRSRLPEEEGKAVVAKYTSPPQAPDTVSKHSLFTELWKDPTANRRTPIEALNSLKTITVKDHPFKLTFEEGARVYTAKAPVRETVSREGLEELSRIMNVDGKNVFEVRAAKALEGKIGLALTSNNSSNYDGPSFLTDSKGVSGLEPLFNRFMPELCGAVLRQLLVETPDVNIRSLSGKDYLLRSFFQQSWGSGVFIPFFMEVLRETVNVSQKLEAQTTGSFLSSGSSHAGGVPAARRAPVSSERITALRTGRDLSEVFERKTIKEALKKVYEKVLARPAEANEFFIFGKVGVQSINQIEYGKKFTDQLGQVKAPVIVSSSIGLYTSLLHYLPDLTNLDCHMLNATLTNEFDRNVEDFLKERAWVDVTNKFRRDYGELRLSRIISAYYSVFYSIVTAKLSAYLKMVMDSVTDVSENRRIYQQTLRKIKNDAGSIVDLIRINTEYAEKPAELTLKAEIRSDLSDSDFAGLMEEAAGKAEDSVVDLTVKDLLGNDFSWVSHWYATTIPPQRVYMTNLSTFRNGFGLPQYLMTGTYPVSDLFFRERTKGALPGVPGSFYKERISFDVTEAVSDTESEGFSPRAATVQQITREVKYGLPALFLCTTSIETGIGDALPTFPALGKADTIFDPQSMPLIVGDRMFMHKEVSPRSERKWVNRFFDNDYLSSYAVAVMWSGKFGEHIRLMYYNIRTGEVIHLYNMPGLNSGMGTPDNDKLPSGIREWAEETNPFRRLPSDLGPVTAMLSVVPWEILKKDRKDIDKSIQVEFWKRFQEEMEKREDLSPEWDPRKIVADAAAEYADYLRKNSRAVQLTATDPKDNIERMKNRIISANQLGQIHITSPYARLRGGNTYHNGTDLAPATEDDSIILYAPCDGRVQFFLNQSRSGRTEGYGLYLRFQPKLVENNMPPASFILTMGHLSIGRTFGHLAKREVRSNYRPVIQNYFGRNVKEDDFGKDEEYNMSPKKDRKNENHSVPEGKFPYEGPEKSVTDFIRGDGNVVFEVERGDPIAVMGHTGINRTQDPANKWGTHLHLSAHPVNTFSNWNKVSSLAGGPFWINTGSPDNLEDLARRTDHPKYVLGVPDEYFPQGVYSVKVEDSFQERLSRAISGAANRPLTVPKGPSTDLVEFVAQRTAYDTILEVISGVQLSPVTLPYHDPYFVDGNFPFAVVFKDDIVLTNLTAHTLSSAGPGRVQTVLNFAPGISVKKLTGLILETMKGGQIHSNFFTDRPELGILPAHVIDFYNRTLLNIDVMNEEYKTFFGKDNFSFDWRQAVVVKKGGYTHTLHEILTGSDPGLISLFSQATRDDITIDLKGVMPSFSKEREASLMFTDREWDPANLYTVLTGRGEAFRPDTKRFDRAAVPYDLSDPASGYEAKAKNRLNDPDSSGVVNSRRFFYDWQNFFRYLKKFIR